LQYLMAVQAPAYPLGPDAFATESAFARHLVELRQLLGKDFDRLVLVAPRLSDEAYAAAKSQLEVITLAQHGISFVPAHATTDSFLTFWTKRAGPIWRSVRDVVKNSAIVHSAVADDAKRPLMALVNLAAWWHRRPVMFVVDIDFRCDTRRNYELGRSTYRSYIFNRYVVDPFKWVQVWLAARSFDVVLLKGMGMVRDFGRGRPNVKFFLDAVHGHGDVLDGPARAKRQERLRLAGRPLEVAYFGRMVAYKGLEHAVEAVRIARSQGRDVRLTLIGDGECRADLLARAEAAGLGDAVRYIPPVRYGKELFDLLEAADVAVATPVLEDTPRAALDAMARGLPVVAFDTEYFRTLAEQSGAVALAKRGDAASLAAEFARLADHRDTLAELSARAIAYAAENTQTTWLEKRMAWARDAMRPAAG